MSEINNAHRILDIIKNITSNRESGRLEISASGTHGALLFNDGKLVDATLGSLKGFQAVNAAVSLRDVEFGFVHSPFTPPSGSITHSERIILSHFFGIEAAEMEDPHSNPEVDWNMTPEPVVPLAEVEKVPQDDLQDTPTIEARPVAPVEPAVIESEIVGDPITVAHKFPFQRARVALYLVLIVALTAAVAVALISKLNAHRQVASVAASVESKSQPAPEPSFASQQQQRDVNAHDLAGEWKVINTVQKTAYKSYGNMEVGFRLRINQTGNDITATGEKFSENGRNLPANARTPIHLTGSIDGDKIVATFVEDGSMRRSNGRFVWKLQTDGTGLTGTFVSTAANSSGKSAATKQP